MVLKYSLTILIAASWLIKLVVHFHLDWKTNRRREFPLANMLPIDYLFPYLYPVGKKYLREEKICNVFYWVAIGSTIFFLVWKFLYPKDWI